MDKTMNRLQNAAVNNALLEINDWQCSGDVDYLESAVAYLHNNLASNHLITYKNETHSIYAWARKLGINPKTLGERIRRGWSVERALTQAVEGR